MKVLFVFDHKFCRDSDGRYYSDGQFPYRLWQRYLDVFDEVVVAARVRPLRQDEKLENLNLSSGPQVSFIELPSLSSPLAALTARRQAAAKIRQALVCCDGLIVRVVSELSRVAYQVAEELHKPWAVEVVGCTFDSLWHYGTWQGKVYAPYAAYAARKMIKKAPFALYVTQDFLQRRYPCKGRTLGCSDVQLVEREESVLAIRREKMETGRTPLNIGLIGSLAHNQKGVSVALSALKTIKEQVAPFRFHILGNGNIEKWKNRATAMGLGKNVVFCGSLPQGRAVNAWLDEIDLYIQPSFVESLPRALVEAMARGCPALGSTVGGIPELLAAECLHRPGDSHGLALLLKQALQDQDWRMRQAKRNFDLTRSYSQEALDKHRREFWLAFVDFCKESRKKWK